METTEKKRLLKSLVFPGILLIILWAVFIVETLLKADFSTLGLLPQSISGLKGIFFSPLLHGSYAHLSANSVPLFVLLAGLFYYYDKKGYGILAWAWIITGFWVWSFAKDTGYHIGASGIVYALAAFHFTGGLLRREPRLMAFALLVVFLYGGLIWGAIPDFLPEKNISWESHLMGLLAGVIIALFYRNSGPQRIEHKWEDEEEWIEPDQEPTAIDEQSRIKEESINPQNTTVPPPIVYHYKQNHDPDK
ncbi:MAG: rhomboid family intramembrane serine protease [Bacteroidales bacterium]|nr:rhomboid family intramembrane serine protease [Bacteroidales bacterium]